MIDVFSPEKRSQVMAAIRSKDTSPERKVRSIVHALGYRYRLHRKSLPGNPDLVFPSRKKVIFVHGCFWHQHHKCKLASSPKSNQEYWHPKLERNVERDKSHKERIQLLGWESMVIWECETRDPELIAKRVTEYLD